MNRRLSGPGALALLALVSTTTAARAEYPEFGGTQPGDLTALPTFTNLGDGSRLYMVTA